VTDLSLLEAEPPAGYVAFVARNLAPARDEATQLIGDEQVADRLYPDALTDVALHWRWLELRRRCLRRPDAAEEYLHRALVRRCQAQQLAWAAEPDDDLDIRVLAPEEPGYHWPRPSASVAVRLAPQLASTVRPELLPVADAAIAWWHAYETHRRRRWIAVLAVAGLLLVMLARHLVPE
jgi:hypothetical protein